MRLVSIVIAFALIVPATLPNPATAADERRRKAKSHKTYEQPHRRAYRSSTEAPDGTCRRDTGRTFDSLSLNNRCDREEFWLRFNDTGGNDRN